MGFSLVALTPVVALALYIYAAIIRSRKRHTLALPPGPPGLPLLGNVLDIPKEREWVSYAKWSREYDSDLIYLNLCGRPVIVVNSVEVATELFEKRSAIYSDRPPMTMLNDLVGFGFHFAFQRYGEDWRERRKVFHQEFNPTASLCHRKTELVHARVLLARLLKTPDDYRAHLRHMAGATILSIAYGIQVQPKNDPYVNTAEIAMHAMACTGNSGAYLVDVLSWLRHLPAWFPGAGFQAQAQEWRKSVQAMVDMPFNFVKKSLEEGTAVPSFTTRSLEGIGDCRKHVRDHRETVISEAAAAMYAGGSDTTVSALGTFIYAMLKYPDVQRKAQWAVDNVLQGQRLPEFSDESELKYITAIVKEVLRIQPVVPLAVQHRLMTDDTYQGYQLPAGVTVIPNAWAMLHDPVIYPEPEKFKPERFLSSPHSEDKTGRKVPDPIVAFGFGRRICPGRHMAMDAIWISVASILACFDILPPLDEHGVEIHADCEYSSGLLCYPQPFKCRIRPRSKGAEKLIHDAADAICGDLTA